MSEALLILGILLAGSATAIVVLWISRRLHDLHREQTMVFLQMLVPIKESKEDKETSSEQFSTGQDFKEVLGVMDHLYQSLYSLYNSKISRLWRGQDFFSVEYAALAGEILFFVVCPRKIVHLMEKQITSFYPDTVINEVEDYNIFTVNSHAVSENFLPAKDYSFSFKTYEELKSDPLNTITNAFSKLKPEEGGAVQFVLRPANPGWQQKLSKAAVKMINPKKHRAKWYNPITWMSAAFHLLTTGEDVVDLNTESQETGNRVTSVQEERSKMLDEKACNPGFHCTIRAVGSAETHAKAEEVLKGIISAFGQFSGPRGNSFERPSVVSRSETIRRFIRRCPRRTIALAMRYKKMIAGTSELASFWHLPNIKYNKVETIKWQKFKIAPLPKDIPNDGDLYLGTNTYRGDKRKITMLNEDRFRHFYVIGQTGTGKSSIIQTMAKQDFHKGNGLCIIDPHGSLVEDLLPYIPRERADDVIYFNPADTERPIGLNLLEADSPEEKDLIALDAMNMMVKMFGEEIFGPRIQDYFRNGCLTLMEDDEEGGAITDLVKLFTDEEWQQYKVSKVKNPIVKAFWQKQMAMTGAREKGEIIPYFAAKFGQFYTNSLIRNIVGQTRSAFDIAECMNSGKIILANLSKGLVGDLNSQLLGMIFTNKVQVAAMRRQKLNKEKRRDFFLYIDEFQNFVTPSIESILSEARKYRLGLILAHQYIDQLEKENKLSGAVSLKGAVFGNVGTMLFYKIGPQDAETCAKEMAPVFSEQDLVNLEAFKGAMKLSVNNQPSRPFSIDVPKPWLDTTYPKDESASEAFKQLSRLTYGRQKDFVDREILRRIG